mmetsp:Transcript_17511/g.23376  ORF Transcript_17511/g.23376 Transcript_17511/m.23376 type:complete len:251 (-) Transcript_17511:46-798(-)
MYIFIILFSDFLSNQYIPLLEQNFEVSKENFCATRSTCCTARKGFLDAFFSFPDIEDSLDECISSTCPEHDCVVLTGHSQGGALALIAAYKYARTNPIVITFGQPPAMKSCAFINSKKVFRYINTSTENFMGVAVFGLELEYDIVSGTPLLYDDMIGHGLVLADDKYGYTQIAYQGLNTARSMKNVDFAAHGMEQYVARIEDLVSQTKYLNRHLQANGFHIGSPCNEDYECASEYCSFGYCKKCPRWRTC